MQDARARAVEKTREIARGLRPQALDEFGLRSALTTLAAGFAERSGLRVHQRVAEDLPELAPEHDLAIYRTAQESLTNVVRHAEATARARLARRRRTARVVLSVARRRARRRARALHDAGGVGGMRERAMLVGGRLSIGRGALGGTEVRLEVPARVSVPLTTNIVIADDHPLIRTGLRKVLDAAPDLRVVGEASDGIEAVELALREDVHLAILDVAMPLRTGLQAARELARRRPELRILMLSMHDTEDYCFQALKAGASGYVLKTVADRELVEACRAAMRGEPFLSPPAVRALMRAYLDDPARRVEHPLTARELEVVKLVAEAHTTEQIARLLVISPRTVERHRENILAKLGMRDRVELTRWAIRHGLVEP